MYIHSFQWTWKNNLTIKKLLGPLLHRNNSCLVETSGRYPWLRLVPFWQCILTWFLLDSGNHLALRYQGFFGRCYNADERHCLSEFNNFVTFSMAVLRSNVWIVLLSMSKNEERNKCYSTHLLLHTLLGNMVKE